MSKTNKNIRKYLGSKFYKVMEDDSVRLIRLIHINDFHDKVTIKDEDTGKKEEVKFESLAGYTPLTPFGKITFAKVKMYEDKNPNKSVFDVIVAAYRDLDIQIEQYEPFVVARQNVTDFWYNLLTTVEENPYVGASVTKENCPPNIPYAIMMACDEPVKFEMINLYIDDTLDSIFDCIDIEYYDNTFKKLFDDHMKFLNPLYDNKVETTISSKDGWCKNLRTFLTENNFIKDLDDMRGVYSYDFNLQEEMDHDEVEDIYTFKEEVLQFFNETHSTNADKCVAIKYDYDINLGEFNNSNYILIRDNTNQLYIVVYTLAGQYLEKDLQDEASKLSVSDRLRLEFYNKYMSNN